MIKIQCDRGVWLNGSWSRNCDHPTKHTTTRSLNIFIHIYIYIYSEGSRPRIAKRAVDLRHDIYRDQKPHGIGPNQPKPHNLPFAIAPARSMWSEIVSGARSINMRSVNAAWCGTPYTKTSRDEGHVTSKRVPPK